ncbi:MAG: DMT family transporter [Alphaproteobacteria bacterium]|nr:DMT family transporter [Alphaproteobacteria bacterium]
MNQRHETTIAILMFMGVLLGNVVIFTIVPFLSAPDLVGLRVSAGQALGLLAADAPAPAPIHAFQIMLCYSIIATGCMLPWAIKQGRAGLATQRKKAYIARGFLEYGSFTLSFFSLGFLGENFTLPMHTALNFVTPIFATLATILILKERSHLHTWIALLAGVAGVLIITRPGMLPLSPGVFYVLGAALGFSLCGVVIKLLCRTESSRHIAFYMLATTTVLALPAGISHWRNPGVDGWFWLGLIGVIAYLQQVYVAKAISKVPFMVLIPINFVSLLFATVMSYFVYAKLIDQWTLLGAVIILAGTIYNANRNRNIATREAQVAATV